MTVGELRDLSVDAQRQRDRDRTLGAPRRQQGRPSGARGWQWTEFRHTEHRDPAIQLAPGPAQLADQRAAAVPHDVQVRPGRRALSPASRISCSARRASSIQRPRGAGWAVLSRQSRCRPPAVAGVAARAGARQHTGSICWTAPRRLGKPSWRPCGGLYDHEAVATRMIFPSLSRSLVRLGSGGSVDVGQRCDGAGGDAADGG